MNYTKFFTSWLLLPLLIIAGMWLFSASLTPILGPSLGQYTSYGVTFIITVAGLYIYRKTISRKGRE